MQPDVRALGLEEAKKILAESGWTLDEIAFTAPPRGGIPSGDARVVRQRSSGVNCCSLVVSYRTFHREGQCTK